MKIKLCGVRNVEDALMCVKAGADEIGVVFAPRSKRRVSVAAAAAIRAALPAKVPLVGVFLDAELPEIVEAARDAGLTAVQLHGRIPAGALPVPLYAAVQVAAQGDVEAIAQLPAGVARVLLDGPAGGSGLSFAWSLAHRARALYDGPLFIAGGLTPDNVWEAVREARPDGVDVASGIEGPDGFKDAVKVRRFVAAARSA